MKMQAIKTSCIKRSVAKYKIVYRIEHPITHIGPYRSDINTSLIDKMFDAHSCYVSASHPTPQREGFKYELLEKCVCGCKDMQQLKDWFGIFLKPLLKEGFTLTKYIVKTEGVHFGKYQTLIETKKVIKRTVVKYK